MQAFAILGGNACKASGRREKGNNSLFEVGPPGGGTIWGLEGYYFGGICVLKIISGVNTPNNTPPWAGTSVGEKKQCRGWHYLGGTPWYRPSDKSQVGRSQLPPSPPFPHRRNNLHFSGFQNSGTPKLLPKVPEGEPWKNFFSERSLLCEWLQ